MEGFSIQGDLDVSFESYEDLLNDTNNKDTKIPNANYRGGVASHLLDVWPLPNIDLKRCSVTKLTPFECQKFFEKILNLSFDALKLDRKKDKLEQPCVLAEFFENIDPENYPEAIDFLKEKGVNISYAFKSFLVSEAMPYTDSLDEDECIIDMEKFSKIGRLFLEKGAKLDERYSGKTSILDFVFIMCGEDTDFAKAVLDLSDDVSSLKMPSFGVGYNLKEFFTRLINEDDIEEIEDNELFQILQQYDLPERFIFPKGDQDCAGCSSLLFYMAMIENDFDKVRSLIKDVKINLNARYLGFERPVGLDFYAENVRGGLPFFDEDDDEKQILAISPEMFDLLLEEGLDISDDNLTVCNMNGNSIAEEILKQTKSYEYLKVLAKHGYDFTRVTYPCSWTDATDIFLMELIAQHIGVFDTAEIDQPLYDFIKYLVDNQYIDKTQVHTISSYDDHDFDNDHLVAYKKTLAELFEEKYAKSKWGREIYDPSFKNDRTIVYKILELLK